MDKIGNLALGNTYSCGFISTKPGVKRLGMWLEVDRLNQKENFSRGNCVLCCYFCNKDKNDIFFGDENTKFMSNRVDYFKRNLHL